MSSPIIITTMTTPTIADYTAMTIPAMYAWTQNQGYEMKHAHITHPTNRSIVWTKISILLSLLRHHAHAKLIVWLDADCLITTPARRIEHLLPLGFNLRPMLHAAKDQNGFNSGVLLIEPSNEAYQMLTAALARTDLDAHSWPEQEAIKQECDKRPGLLQYVRKTLINSYPDDWRPGDLLCHFAGKPNKPKAIDEFLHL